MNIDKQLQQNIPFLSQLPGLLPHIGSGYAQAKRKIIIVGESHYLAASLNNKVTREDWYDNILNILEKIRDAKSLGYIHTRGVISDMLTGKFNKAYTIFYNLNREYQDVYETSDHLFKSAVYLNYFQRPAEVTGDSINNNKRDNEVAYDNLIKLSSILKPDIVIFVSSKSFEAFQSEDSKQKLAGFTFDTVPHAASAWWNKKSKNYGTNEDGSLRTGKQKFRAILKSL
ncbi:hypothetical protein QO206_05620 [Leeuwenhoekiella aequorea]|uniref:hypothetical protein n=1 Tax=Leeuwenhoekiella aequorea TaxID=283736 RepID=UPI00352E8CD4|tara:strand:- start:43770 stop:44453 length:684 start_codon:yes stop_codon:yes gene_type:complete